ncbi:MAG: nucleoside-diphosphate kinase [Planctomycetaceae bacterium]|jgi:nucleoside-diphosphate kinase|nr:nucleoside-diphosphate kinase [Planctomycetaceae bacterium]
MQKTLILLKPDTVRRRYAGEMISRLEKKGLNIMAMKMLRVTKELAAKHYAEHTGKAFYPDLEEYITSGPVIAMVVSGPEAVAVVRLLTGPTNGIIAPPGTIRGDFSLSNSYNLIHASDSETSAAREMAIFFAPDEILDTNITE